MVLKIRPHNVCPSKIRTFQVCVESKQVPNDALSKWIKIWLQNETSTLVYVSVKIFPCHKLAIAYISNQSKLWYTCCTCRTCPSQWNSIDECRTTYLTTIFDDKQCNNNVYAFKVGHFSSMLFSLRIRIDQSRKTPSTALVLHHFGDWTAFTLCKINTRWKKFIYSDKSQKVSLSRNERWHTASADVT